jgi:hypothetical protein
MRFIRRSFALSLLFSSALACFASPAAATSTSLIISPGPEVAAGTIVSLTATVTGTSVSNGFVMFCNASAAYCEDNAVLGTATAVKIDATQLSATLHLTLGVGVHSIKAVFAPTSTNLTSTSEVQTLTVTPPPTFKSTTSLSASGDSGNYSLSGTVSAIGAQTMSGAVTIYDVSQNNAEVGTAQLEKSEWSLSAPLYLYSGARPVAEAAADLNNDGKLDLIWVTGVTAGSLSILLGNGDGTFLSRTDYAVMTHPTQVAVGDFNGDGTLDIAIVGGQALGEMEILIGNGDGTFQSPASYTIDPSPTQFAVGDLNSDGTADVVILNSASSAGSISIMLGVGNGTFQPPNKYSIDQNPDSLSITDFNRDGHPDIAVAYNVTPEISVLIGNGDGTFRSKVDYPMTTATNSVAVGDFDGDGNPDIVTNDSASTIALLMGNGDGTFRPKINYTTSRPAAWLVTGDFNGDGATDVAFSNGGTGTISYMYGRGDGSFQQLVDLNTAQVSYYQIVSVDLNSDGMADLVGGSYGGLFAMFGEQVAHYAASGISVIGSGTHQIFAQYSGDSSRLGSQSSTVPLMASKANTSISLYSNKPLTSYGETVSITAILPNIAGIEPTGSVTFLDNGTIIASAPLEAGAAVITTGHLLVGAHTITCNYGGDQNYALSNSGNLYETIDKAVAHLGLSSSMNPAVFGSSITLTASLVQGATGTVSFSDGTVPLGTATVYSGTANLIVSQLTAGTHAITATYSGDANYQ